MAPMMVGLSAPVAARQASHEIAVNFIDPNPLQPRREFDEATLKGLADSIAQYGVLQPIVVSPSDRGRYWLVVGERRLRAAKMAGLETIPVIIRTTEDQDKLELALVENIQREDLNQLEEGMAYQRLKDEFGLSVEEIAQRVGKSRPEIHGRLHLLGLPKEVKEAFLSGKITYNRARALSILREEPEKLMAIWREAVENKWNDNELERYAARRKSKKLIEKHGRNKPRQNPIVIEKERELEDVFGTRVHLTHYNGRSTIQFKFFSDEEFFKTVERLLSLRD